MMCYVCDILRASKASLIFVLILGWFCNTGNTCKYYKNTCKNSCKVLQENENTRKNCVFKKSCKLAKIWHAKNDVVLDPVANRTACCGVFGDVSHIFGCFLFFARRSLR